MAHPKRKQSKSRTRKRRAVYYGSLKAPSTAVCSNCGSTKQMHRACPDCGYYRGREVVEREESI
ncbi:MAG: 50S ribosomal protein L32 [Bacteroidota bacterium]